MILAWLLAAFIFIPLVELAVLIQIGRHLGTPGTLALVLLTGVAGALLVKLQGIMVMTRIHRDMAAHRLPANSLLDGAMILLAGALLITPGLLTDAVGFALLIPPVRAAVRTWLRRKFERAVQFEDTSASWSGPTLDIDVEEETSEW